MISWFSPFLSLKESKDSAFSHPLKTCFASSLAAEVSSLPSFLFFFSMTRISDYHLKKENYFVIKWDRERKREREEGFTQFFHWNVTLTLLLGVLPLIFSPKAKVEEGREEERGERRKWLQNCFWDSNPSPLDFLLIEYQVRTGGKWLSFHSPHWSPV